MNATPNHLKALILLALPLLIGQLARTLMSVIDIAIVGSISPADMATLAIGGSVWFPVFVFGSGTMQSIVPRIAAAHARQDDAQTVKFIHQGVWLALGLSLLIALAIISLRPFLYLLGMAAEVRAMTAQYLLALAAGAPGILLFFTFRNIAQATGDTRSGMQIGLAGLALNIPLSFILAQGWFGLPALGALGCGIAFAAVNWFCGLGLGLYLARQPKFRRLPILRVHVMPERAVLIMLLKIGAPIALAFFAEVLLLDAVGLMIAGLDTASVAAHGILINLCALIYTLPCALGSIVTVRVAQYVGTHDKPNAAAVAKTGVLLWLGLSCALSAVLLWFDQSVLALYTPNAGIVGKAIGVLAFAMAMQLCDGLQTVLAAVLRGYEDNRAIFLITVASYWAIGLPLAFVLGRLGPVASLAGLGGYWAGVVLALACSTLGLGLRLLVVMGRIRAPEAGTRRAD